MAEIMGKDMRIFLDDVIMDLSLCYSPFKENTMNVYFCRFINKQLKDSETLEVVAKDERLAYMLAAQEFGADIDDLESGKYILRVTKVDSYE